MSDQLVIAALRRRIAELETENERLTQRVRGFESEIRFLAPLEWKLSPTENVILGVLYSREIATGDAMMSASEPYRKCAGIEPDWHVIAVWICRLRKKLGPLGIEIDHRWGTRDYWLTSEGKTRLGVYLNRQNLAA